jgi:hypothetical protein
MTTTATTTATPETMDPAAARKLALATAAEAIMEDNDATLREYFAGMMSGEYCDGQSHQLYLDLDDDSIVIITHESSTSWSQRKDGSLVQLDEFTASVYPYDHAPYDAETDSLGDFGYGSGDWWSDRIEDAVRKALAAA